MEDETPTYDEPQILDSLSERKQIVLYVVPICSALLSVAGSLTIVIKILRFRPKTPYDRFMLGLSSCDVLSSITWVINPHLRPMESGALGAIGNHATCVAGGFLTQISISSWWYNCQLSIYFLLMVISKVRRRNYVQKCELWMHLSVLWFPITAIMGLFRGWFGVQGTGTCYIKDADVKWIILGLPVLITYATLIINNITIYAIVRKTLGPFKRDIGPMSRQEKLKREVSISMFLYVGGFFIVISPAFAVQILTGYGLDDAIENLFPLLVLSSMCLPIQGFFNYFIYIKPLYTRFRAAYPNKSIWFVLRKASFESTAPRTSNYPRLADGVTEGGGTMYDISSEFNPNQALFNPDTPWLSSSPTSLPSEFATNTTNIAETDAKDEESENESTEESTEIQIEDSCEFYRIAKEAL